MIRARLLRLAKQLPGMRRLMSREEHLLRQHATLEEERDELLDHTRRLETERTALEKQCRRLEAALNCEAQILPPGHFYSPIPSQDDVQDYIKGRSAVVPDFIPAIDLRMDAQLALLDRFSSYYAELPFSPEKTECYRYFYENPGYSYSDAIFFFCMLRHAKPKRVIEVGSGYSSCVLLDTRDKFFDGRLEVTCVEPYPERLLSLIQPADRQRIEIVPSKLQHIDIDRFRALEPNDMLVIDSTHVCKVNSDVRYIFAQILPALAPGVYVHFHDIFYPFEYPDHWLREGRAWNEIYMLQAFLEFNNSFEVVVFNSYLQKKQREKVGDLMPLCLRNEGGSIWLRKRLLREP